MSRVEKVPIDTLLEKLICDCGGEMKATAQCLNNYLRNVEKQYECSRCGKFELTTELYPRIVQQERVLRLSYIADMVSVTNEELGKSSEVQQRVEGQVRDAGSKKPPEQTEGDSQIPQPALASANADSVVATKPRVESPASIVGQPRASMAQSEKQLNYSKPGESNQ